MKVVSNIEHWADAHHPKWLDIIRILLGLVLIAKGISFVKNTDQMIGMLYGSPDEFRLIALIHYIIGVHIVVGLMITFGLLTRVAVLFQIPILIGAMIFMNVSKEFFMFSSEFLFLVLVLSLLIFFFIYGSGPISVDNYIRKHAD